MGIVRRFSGLVVLLWLTTVVKAAPPSKLPTWRALDQAVGKEDYLEAKNLADAILQRGVPSDRLQASKVYGRILLALGQKEMARQYLVMLSKPGADPSGGKMTTIYTAWFKALEGKSEEGIKALEKFLADDSSHDAMTAEAADVLAMLYMARGEQEKAKKAVDLGLRALQYQDTKDGYLLALLRGRLKSNLVASEAKRRYDAAEKLRAEKKFAEAGAMFAQVRAMYPKDSYAHASGFRMGQCYLGLDRASQASTHWQQFIEESPAGPWRGQAYMALVDLALQAQLDLTKAAEYALAATAVLDKPLAKEAAPSWKESAYEIYLRQGIVCLASGRFEAAAQALERAKKAASGAAKPALLDRLIEASKQKWKLIPDELATGDAKATVAISLGIIYNVLQEHGLARDFFNLVLTGPMRSRLPAHRSFAEFGLAQGLAAIENSMEQSSSRSSAEKAGGKAAASSSRISSSSPMPSAKAVYEASLKEYPNGSWHDETLYCLAMLIQDQADAKFGRPRIDEKDGPKARGPTKALSPKEREREAKAEEERLAALRIAKGEALPYWKELIARYPQSPRCEQAFYYAGVLVYQMAEATPAGASGPLWEEAASRLSRFCQTYPKSLYAGDAYVRQIDVALEQKYDVPAAMALADLGIQWAKSQNVNVASNADGTATAESVSKAASAIKSAAPSSPTWGQAGAKPAASLLSDLYNLYLRAAILAYVEERYDDANQYLGAAGPARPTNGMEGNFDLQKIGLHILMVCSKRKEPSWCPEAMTAATTDGQKLALKLADTYLHCQRPEKAEAIYNQILVGKASLGRPDRAVESYCLMQLAGAYSMRKVNYEMSIDYYKRFCERGYADFPWAATAIMRLAVLEHNRSQDPKPAIERYQYILSKYPNHRVAERALYFLATDAARVGNKGLAEVSCKAFIERYPNSGWTSHVQRVLNEEIRGSKDNGDEQE